MAGCGASSLWGPSPALVTALVALLGLGLAAYIVGPRLYWYAVEALTATATCPTCNCNCDARPLLDLPDVLTQLRVTIGAQDIIRCSHAVNFLVSLVLTLYGYSTSFFMKHVLTYCIEPGLVYFSKLQVI
ncbi:unnamed protein product [Miscanthus lutarioriparius]|uniref:Uncharacterized protein n=1 Tax=Miscanthus lutarioriparius TaxID=422564 RepID=A0A811PNB7_9POAL|nr:unnamed protein product [Miscanthus lutarioriparius]